MNTRGQGLYRVQEAGMSHVMHLHMFQTINSGDASGSSLTTFLPLSCEKKYKIKIKKNTPAEGGHEFLKSHSGGQSTQTWLLAVTG